MSTAGEENCDSIKRFVSEIDIQTSSLDDFIRILTILQSFDIDKCDSFSFFVTSTPTTENIFRTFYDLLKKFVNEQNEQMQAVEQYMFRIQDIRRQISRFADMFHFLKEADASGESDTKVKEAFLRRFSSNSQFAKNVYNLVEWKKRQRVTADDMTMYAFTGAQMGGRSKRKKNYTSVSKGKNRNSYRRINRMSYKKNKSRRALHRKKSVKLLTK
jgi:6-pyruvoyl-tetrahydropterin synthase